MSVRRTDLRFALPRSPRNAVVLGDLDAWRDGLTLAGVELAGPAHLSPDLVVAPRELAADAITGAAEAVIVEGRGGARALTRAGYSARRYLPLPTLDEPDLVLPLEAGTAPRYALERWRPALTPTKRARDRAVLLLLAHNLLPDLRRSQALGLRQPAPPFPIAAAAALGIPPDVHWFLTLGQGDALTRVAFHLFPRGATEPAWVLKVGRVPGYREPFDRDEQGLHLARTAGDIVGARAPTFVGRFEAGGLHGSVETAAVGERLSTLVARDRPAARVAVDEIAGWIVRLGKATVAPSETLANERRRLAENVLPRWLDLGAPSDLVDRLPPLPAVLQHNDLGSWNLVVQPGGGFVALDWESARRHGLPLWDLLYFLVDALPLLAGAHTAEERVQEAVRLLRGEAPLSEVLFRWLDTAARDLSVPADALGPIATLGWLHHGFSRVLRARAVGDAEAGSLATPSPIDRLAPLWLRDPALGPDWRARRG